MSIRGSLKRCRLFANLTDEQLEKLLPFCQEVAADAGTMVFNQGGPAKYLYVVTIGRVALQMSVPTPTGGPSHLATVATEGPGDAFGWSAIVDGGAMTLSARAMDLDVERCSLIRIDGEGLRRLMGHEPQLGYEVIVGLAKLLADRLMATRETLVYERGWADVA